MNALADRLSMWLDRRSAPEAGTIRLTQRRVYVLPTRNGLLLAVTLLLMLGGCLNYNLGLGYVLTFLLASVALVAMLHTFRNLAHLELAGGRAEPVFAGGNALFPVLIRNPTGVARLSVGVALVHGALRWGARAGAATEWCDLPTATTATTPLRVPAPRRGELHLPRVRVSTTFPLGLFTAWSNVHLDLRCLVYPCPEAGPVPMPLPQPGEAQGARRGRGQDDFAGLRRYQPGDSPRQVAWKAVARGQDLLTKQFAGTGAGALWLRWRDVPREFGLEAKLSRLTRWVVEAGRAGVPFGLDLPGFRLEPGTGHEHEHACLAALALFPQDA
jgi:uncharacterized protein (DUF58 family)